MNDVALQEAPAAEPTGGWAAQPQDPRGLQPVISEADVAAWRETRAAVRELAERERWTMAEVHRRSGTAQATLSSWYAGKYKGVYANVTADLQRWLAAHAEASRALTTSLVEPGFIRTRTAGKVLDALLYAQELPGMVLVTLGPGMGKTSTIEHVLRTRPHTYCITLSASVRSVPAINREIATAVDVSAFPRELRTRIGEKIRRNGKRTLLMIDEAQNLDDHAVDELRFYLDRYRCGIALLGNEDVYKRWGATQPREGYGQLHRRFSYRIRELKPHADDIEAFVQAWGIQDPDILKILRVIGRKPGALGQIAETVKLAGIIAAQRGRMIGVDDVREAWINRAGEELR